MLLERRTMDFPWSVVRSDKCLPGQGMWWPPGLDPGTKGFMRPWSAVISAGIARKNGWGGWIRTNDDGVRVSPAVANSCTKPKKCKQVFRRGAPPRPKPSVYRTWGVQGCAIEPPKLKILWRFLRLTTELFPIRSGRGAEAGGQSSKAVCSSNTGRPRWTDVPLPQ